MSLTSPRKSERTGEDLNRREHTSQNVQKIFLQRVGLIIPHPAPIGQNQRFPFYFDAQILIREIPIRFLHLPNPQHHTAILNSRLLGDARFYKGGAASIIDPNAIGFDKFKFRE